MKKYFVGQILSWNMHNNTRTLPWKGEKNAYKIWLSEIILQQTKVEQGLKYYEKFVKSFPTIYQLATAQDNKVFKMWEGLGYYSRCKNLLFTARKIVELYDGVFPNDYATILSLKGIGNYTAAAIGSFAFALPYAVVDGNVYRVLSRYFGNSTPIDSTEGKKYFAQLAQELLPTNQSASYNQAIMDLGATVCKPKLAQCTQCPLQKKCVAYVTNSVYSLPVKQKKLVIKKRQFLYVIAVSKNKVLVHKRTQKDIWQNLYEFIAVELVNNEDLQLINIEQNILEKLGPLQYSIIHKSDIYVQKLTHQTVHAKFITITTNQLTKLDKYIWVNKKQLQKLPFASLINTFLIKEKSTIIF